MYKEIPPVARRDFISGIHLSGQQPRPCREARSWMHPQRYSGIGINKLREITNDEHCKFVLWVGNKRLIKRRLFDAYIEQVYSI